MKNDYLKGFAGMPRKGFKRTKKTATDDPKVFGVSLIDVCKREEQSIPTIVVEATEYLEKHGLQVEGLFRIPGNAMIQDQLKAYYDGEQREVTINNCEDAYAVGCLLKCYLRELPEPLFPSRLYSSFLSSQKGPDPYERLKNLRTLIKGLPGPHKDLLIHLGKFLLEVSKHSEVNKMSITNLTIVLAPNLLRPLHESLMGTVEDSRHINAVFESILIEFDYLVLGTSNIPKTVAVPETTSKGKFEGQENTIPQNISAETLSTSCAGPIAPAERISAMKQTASSRKLLLDNMSPMKPIPTSCCPYVDLDNPMEFTKKQIQKSRQSAKRPLEIEKMTCDQLKEEKKDMKWHLRNFDLAYQNQNGHFPTKMEKGVLSPLYRRYSLVVSKVKDLEESDVKETAPFLSLPEDIVGLKEEKLHLQRILIKYQKEFATQNRRPVNFVQDREPHKEEYARYKLVKRRISELEKCSSGL